MRQRRGQRHSAEAPARRAGAERKSPTLAPCSRSGTRGMRLGGLRRYAIRAGRRAGVALSGVKYVSGMEAGGVRWGLSAKERLTKVAWRKTNRTCRGPIVAGKANFVQRPSCRRNQGIVEPYERD